jgi:GH24 family phage-related lysozyme (muramidase)
VNLELTKRWITQWEGSRSRVYKDTKGIPTIGVGLNLTTARAKVAVAALWLDMDELLTGIVELTPIQIDRLLTGSIQEAITASHSLISGFFELPDNQQLVIVDLAFNMGYLTLSKFTETLGAIRAKKWAAASLHLRRSEWFSQVGSKSNQRGWADVAVLGNVSQPQDFLNSNENSNPSE